MFSPSEIAQFKTICSSFGVDLSGEMIDEFETYASLLLEWNRRIHLVSKGDARSDRILRHFIDSLSIFKTVAIPDNPRLLDIGSGAGFPAIPVKIVRKNVKMTLVESTHKKVLFLRKLTEVLRLREISIQDQRAEELTGQVDLKKGFDFVTVKALGKLDEVVRLALPFLKAGGLLIAYKGRTAGEEVREVSLPQECRLRDVARVEVPEMEILRWLVVMEKVEAKRKGS